MPGPPHNLVFNDAVSPQLCTIQDSVKSLIEELYLQAQEETEVQIIFHVCRDKINEFLEEKNDMKTQDVNCEDTITI